MSIAAKTMGQGKRTLPGYFVAPSPPIGTGSLAGPADPIGLKVEIFVNSAWTDISAFVRYANRIRITRGRPNEAAQIQPQTATFTIDNRDGRFYPRLATGPYYGSIGRNTPVRISRMQNGIRRYRFHGEVPAWPTTYDITGTDVTATVTASGQMRRLFQGNQPLRSAFFRAYAQGFSAALAPVAYWPCEDGANATQIASGLPAGQPMTLSGQARPTFATDTSFPCSTALPLLSASIWTGSVPTYSGGTANVLRFLMFIPLTGGFGTGVLARMLTAGTIARVDLTYGTSSNGQLNLNGYSAAGALLFSSGYTSPSIGGYTGGFNGLPVFVSIEMTTAGGSVAYTVTFEPLVAVAGSLGVSFTLLSGTQATATIGNATQVQINPDGNFDDTAAGHVIYQSTLDDLANTSFQLNGWKTEDPAARFIRLCAEQGVAYQLVGSIAGDPTSMGYQTSDTFTNLVQEPANSSASLLFEARDRMALVQRSRVSLYNQSAKLTLDHSAHQLSGPLNPVDDDALTRNDVTVQRVGGSLAQQVLTSGTLSTAAPPAGVGDYPTTYDLSLGSDSLVADQAGWRLHLGTVDQPRYPTISINLRHPTFTSNLDLMNAAITADIGDRLVVTNPQTQLGTDSISQLMLGYTEVMGIFEHDLVFNCAPEDPYKVALLEDVVLGRADTDGSTLTADISSTATTFQITRTNAASPLWTTSGAEFPLDIVMGGERITLSAISGAASPQTATASARSVNGVVKTQTAGTDIRLWQPMILSL